MRGLVARLDGCIVRAPLGARHYAAAPPPAAPTGAMTAEQIAAAQSQSTKLMTDEDRWKEMSRQRRARRKEFKPIFVKMYKERKFMNNLQYREHSDTHPKLPFINIPGRIPTARFQRLREITVGIEENQWLRPDVNVNKMISNPFYVIPAKGLRQQFVTSGREEALTAVYTTEWYEPYYLRFVGGEPPLAEKADDSAGASVKPGKGGEKDGKDAGASPSEKPLVGLGWNWNPSETNLDRKRREAILESFKAKFGSHDFARIAMDEGFKLSEKDIVKPVEPVKATSSAAGGKGKKGKAGGAGGAGGAAGGAAAAAAGAGAGAKAKK